MSTIVSVLVRSTTGVWMINCKTSHLILVVIVALTLAIPARSTMAQSEPLPLAKLGPYGVGQRTMTFVDPNRNERELVTEIWYPAVVPQGQQAKLAEDSTGLRDAPPDTKGAPYPLILYSHGVSIDRIAQADLKYHLASYGFVVAAMAHKTDAAFPLVDGIHRPLDILFVLDQLANLHKGEMVGIIDADYAGVAGYSMGGYTAVAVTGARVDLAYNAEWCTTHPTAYPQACVPKVVADALVAYRAQFNLPLKEGEPWPPFTDKRIRAALPMTTGAGPVFGERGLASATVPTLLMAGTADVEAPYEWAAVFVYNHLGSKDRYLLSLVGANHSFGIAASPFKPVVVHFATAFFGYYLQGREDYARYLTREYVDGIEGLVWGPYEMK